jgi:glutathione peroxidase
MSAIYDFKANGIDKKEVSLKEFEGKVLLIVNVASKCGFTPQYTGLEEIYKKYQARGFEILGFPCNQFGGQEPGTEAEIQSFCSLTYPVSFKMFSKVDVNGDDAHPIYRFLKSEAKGILNTEGVKWNFTKFLVSRDGKTIKRFAPQDKPESLSADIEAMLG